MTFTMDHAAGPADGSRGALKLKENNKTLKTINKTLTRRGAKGRRDAFPRGRCTVCGRVVPVLADGTARFHRGSEACRLGGQTVEPL